jgi:EF-P beta-lysylation protein EpmB
MIPGTQAIRQSPHWQAELAAAVTDPGELIEVLGLSSEWVEPARRVAGRFPLRVPRGFIARMKRGDPADPLLRQVLPLAMEENEVEGFTRDPVGDQAAIAVPGVLQKYPGRVLLTATGACAVHCRYCFRRHFPYSQSMACEDRWAQALALIAQDESLSEVILSGGDPLTLSDRRLAELTEGLKGLGHVKRFRVHTRLPVVLPSRIDAGFLNWLSTLPWPTVVVVHVNHAQELDGSVRAALRALRSAGALLFNQSVLLKGVNDALDVLKNLSEALIEVGVTPYYLHLLDRVAGAAHFEVSHDKAIALAKELTSLLPGYLVPKLVRENQGELSKTPVF